MKNLFNSIWYMVTGKVMLDDIMRAEKNVQYWLDIYHGRQDWLKYDYATLQGFKKERTRKTMNAAKLVCAELAGLVWAENPNIETDESIELFLEENNFYERMEKFSEYGAASGGFALKLYAKDGKLTLDFVAAQNFIPVSWDCKGIYEADFISKKLENEKTVLYLEKHRKTETGYSVTVEVYEMLDGNIVKKIETYEPVEIAMTRPLFVYIATPEANNFSADSPLGISIFANAVDTLYSLDVAFDGLSQEIILGKKRIIVPASSVRSVTDATTGKPVKYFDPSDEVFVAFNTKDTESQKIMDNSVELRIEEIKLAIQTLLDILSVQLGFSAGTFSFDGVSMKTATEVISESSKTFRTKQSYENAIGKGILALLEAVREIGPLYQIQTTKTEYTITWNDSIIEDRNSKTDYWLKRYTNRTCTLEDVLEELDGLPEAEAKAKAEEIRKSTAIIDVGGLFGGNAE